MAAASVLDTVRPPGWPAFGANQWSATAVYTPPTPLEGPQRSIFSLALQKIKLEREDVPEYEFGTRPGDKKEDPIVIEDDDDESLIDDDEDLFTDAEEEPVDHVYEDSLGYDDGVLDLEYECDDGVEDHGYANNLDDHGYENNVGDHGWENNVVDHGYANNVDDRGYEDNVTERGGNDSVTDRGYDDSTESEYEQAYDHDPTPEPEEVEPIGWKTTNEVLQDEIIRLKQRIGVLHQHADEMVAARSPSLVTQTVTRLAGVFADGPLFHVALANLSFSVGAPRMNEWYTDDEALLELFSRAIRILVNSMDPVTPIRTMDHNAARACRPPDALWLLIGTGDPVLYHPLQHALSTMLDGCRGTQRGIAVQALYDRLQRQWNEPFYSDKWRVKASMIARHFERYGELDQADRNDIEAAHNNQNERLKLGKHLVGSRELISAMQKRAAHSERPEQGRSHSFHI